MTIGIGNAIVGGPIAVGKGWSHADTSLLTELRTDNLGLSQRAFARLAADYFTDRTFNGVYHQVRRLDLILNADTAEVVATEIA